MKRKNQTRNFFYSQMLEFFSNIISFVVSWLGKNVQKWKDNPFGGERVTQLTEKQVGGWIFMLFSFRFVWIKIRNFCKTKRDTCKGIIEIYLVILVELKLLHIRAAKRAWQQMLFGLFFIHLWLLNVSPF